ncbi:dihydrolipoamide acetyltransferase family protein [Aeromicrobium sp. Leaf350]|uniref:dihydrolipoamide acetyltransferase family protein n=1 Tax=Aeromicrobium sp. Leaf350 TaxID=2876565 RepID=UPI001E654B0B|nr:dihydrolipoamide acetyltransferase family protein [Aeromicrobium sp. Leaf350]
MAQFRLPDVGEGLTEAEIVTWHVAVGDVVAVNDVLVDIETAKSVVELPSPFAGTVTDLLVEPGRTVPVGTPIVAIGEAAEVADAAAEEKAPEMLVGYGPKDEASGGRRRRRAAVPAAVGATATATVERPRAAPPVRLLARRLGVDLARVPCDGIVTRRDLESFVRSHDGDASRVAGDAAAAPAPAPATAPAPAPSAGDRTVPHTAVRRVTAAAMVASAFTAPHVTEWVEVDVSRTVELVERLRGEREWRDVPVSTLHLVLRSVCLALRRTPELHAVWGDDALTIPEHVGLGVAAATDRGLVVPVVPQAETLDLRGIVEQVGELVAVARSGRLQPAQMAGGTFTVTNIGVFGVDAGTPILPPGQTGILAVGAITRKPWVDEHDQVVPRWVTTLALSFDHRAVDGAQGSRFLRDVADLLHDPALALTV